MNSNVLSPGHIVTMVLADDFYYNNKLVIPADSVVFGSVISLKKTYNNNFKDKVLLRFTQIITPSGVQIPIAGILATGEKTGVLSAEMDFFSDGKGHVNVAVGAPCDLLLIQPITVNPELYNSNY